ncbi:MAG: hypothetical protein ACLTKG_05080 [Collinsella intestinalis]
MPFAALTGYYELARQQERITEPRHGSPRRRPWPFPARSCR